MKLRSVVCAALVAITTVGAFATRTAIVKLVVDPRQATGLRAIHRQGQTFLTWIEVSDAATGLDQADIPVTRVIQLKQQLEARENLRYRIYRSSSPITSTNGLTAIADVAPMSAWNTEFYGVYPKPNQKALRYVIQEGQAPIAYNEGIGVVAPDAAGASYYAVTMVANGRENRAVTRENALQTAVMETVGSGVPVLQRVTRPASFQFVDGAVINYYVRWESPPNSSVPGRPFDYLVAVPPGVRKPAPAGVHMHCWGGSLEDCFGWWFNGDKGTVFISSNEVPYDWWTGYHERIGTASPPVSREDWQRGVVRPYSQRRMLSFLDWATVKFGLDPTRTFAAGSSMGGSGALMMAIRYPSRFAWAAGWVGIHVPAQSPTFKSSYESVFGQPEWGVRFEDGTPVWDYYDDVKYLRSHGAQDTGLLVFSNGKNDSSIGWQQAVDFFRALQDTRQPHVFVWGQDGHGQRTQMPAAGGERTLPIDITTQQTLPAFTHGSLDDDPGKGQPSDGAPTGQANLYLQWESVGVVDRTNGWEMTIGVSSNSPKDQCIVDVTPRRTTSFKPVPGERVFWTNTRGNSVIQSGEAVADQAGLVTLERVAVGKKNRLQIERR